ncbi:MAG TPA: hypothetical protein VKS60_15600 [Stellaceae bacterium]|nr:hypothetical protein [Stellaceae bacterium]
MDTPAPPPPPEQPTPDPKRERADQRLALLRELSDMGMQIARELRDQVMDAGGATEPGTPGHEAAKTFSLVARAVRMTMALEAKLESDIEARFRRQRLIASWREALKGLRNWQEPPGQLPGSVERLLDSACEPDDITALMKELSLVAEPVSAERGLSAETVHMIKCQILGIRPDSMPVAPLKPLPPMPPPPPPFGSRPPPPPRSRPP